MDVEIRDIPESMINMVDIVGIRKFLEITKIYGGSSVYIPLYKSIIRPARDRDIIKKYNGFNEKELAKMYNISVYNIKRIIENKSWINPSWRKHKIWYKYKQVCIFVKENTHFLYYLEQRECYLFIFTIFLDNSFILSVRPCSFPSILTNK